MRLHSSVGCSSLSVVGSLIFPLCLGLPASTQAVLETSNQVLLNPGHERRPGAASHRRAGLCRGRRRGWLPHTAQCPLRRAKYVWKQRAHNRFMLLGNSKSSQATTPLYGPKQVIGIKTSSCTQWKLLKSYCLPTPAGFRNSERCHYWQQDPYFKHIHSSPALLVGSKASCITQQPQRVPKHSK